MNILCKKIPKDIFALGVLLVAALMILIPTQKIYAAGAGSAVSVPINTDYSWNEIKANAKNFWLDQAATAAAKALLHQMTTDIVGWVNSGFHGSPAFLTNPEGFFLDTADEVTGRFLAQAGPLKNLCSPWSLDLRLKIALQQANSPNHGGNYTCTLSTVINSAKNAKINGNSIQGFLNGDFSQGGWDGFVALTTSPNNNPYGLYLSAYSDQLAAVGQKKSQVSSDLLQGAGFLSSEKCTPASASDLAALPIDDDLSTIDPSLSQDAKGNWQRCVKTTPGSVIVGSLLPQLNGGTMELELANSINSVISATVSQLLTQTLKKGLATVSSGGSGLSGGSGGSGASLLSQVFKDATAAKTISTSAGGSTVDTAGLTQVKVVLSNALTLLNTRKTELSNARACFNTKLTGGSLSLANQTLAASQMSAIDADILVVSPTITSISASISDIDSLLNGAAPSSITVGGTTNANALANSSSNIVSDYVSNEANASVAQSTAPTLTDANATLLSAQTTSNNLTGKISSYNSSCNSL